MKFWILLLCAAVFSSEKEHKLEIKKVHDADQYMYLIRHGEREESKHHSSPLTPGGKEQARNIAEFFCGDELKTERPSVFYSSPFLRAIQTAAESTNKLGTELKIDNSLREILPNTSPTVPTTEQLEEYLKHVQKDGHYGDTDADASTEKADEDYNTEKLMQRLGKFLKETKIHENST